MRAEGLAGLDMAMPAQAAGLPWIAEGFEPGAPPGEQYWRISDEPALVN